MKISTTDKCLPKIITTSTWKTNCHLEQNILVYPFSFVFDMHVCMYYDCNYFKEYLHSLKYNFILSLGYNSIIFFIL